MQVYPGEVLYIPANSIHLLENMGDVIAAAFHAPAAAAWGDSMACVKQQNAGCSLRRQGQAAQTTPKTKRTEVDGNQLL